MKMKKTNLYRAIIIEGCELRADYDKALKAIDSCNQCLEGGDFGYAEDLPKTVKIDGVDITLEAIESTESMQPTLHVVVKY